MLLRRVIEHVREPNWFAVIVDFVIIVIGVFIGIQVTNWNEERLNRIDESTLPPVTSSTTETGAGSAFSL